MSRPLGSKVVRLVPHTIEPPRPERAKDHASEDATPSGALERGPLLDDAQLLEALRAGDPAAATSIYRRARSTVDRTVQRLVGSDDAEHDDLVQTSMIAIVNSIRRFRGESSLETWMTRVTANTVFKAIRRRKSERRHIEENRERYDCPSMHAATDTLESRDLLVRVRAILDTIDPVKAFAVLLHDVLGHDLREIAEITEASVAAAQSRLVRGRAELHERIEEDPELAGLLERRAAR